MYEFPNSSVRILVVHFQIRLYESHALKQKRMVRRRLFDRLKNAYNISLMETGAQDTWNLLQGTLAYVALDEQSAQQMDYALEESVLDIIIGEGELISWHSELM